MAIPYTQTSSKRGRGSSTSTLRFSWEKFCDTYGIYYVTQGPNTARNHISIRCPWCGDADPSQHMGLCLDVSNPAWGCFRNADHRGKHPLRLVMALLHCSEEAAKQVIASLKSPNLTLVRHEPEQEVVKPPLVMPKEFLPIVAAGYGSKFIEYLTKRGFDDWEGLVRDYDLRYCLIGDYKWRMIIPIYINDRLVNWTARTVQAAVQPRYKTLSDAVNEENKNAPVALLNIKETIYNQSVLKEGGRALVITEGPLDALKVDYYAKAFGVRATALFGTAITEKQGHVLAQVAKNFRTVDVLLDKDAKGISLRLCEELKERLPNSLVRSRNLPLGFKDPGELPKDEVKKLFA